MTDITSIQSIISGAVQGITELLPVSSTGHLILLDQLFGKNLQLTEIAALHLGTLAAIALVMRDKLKYYFNWKFLLILIPSFVPAGLIGFALQDFIDSKIQTVPVVIAALIIWGIILIAVDIYAKKQKPKTTSLDQVTFKQAIFVGIGQLLALIPGTSRSGATTVLGIASGMSPDTALFFSFLSGMPIIFASGTYGLLKAGIHSNGFSLLLLGIGVSFVTGLIAAILLRKYINRRILTICGTYRIILGIVLSLI